MPLPQPTRRKVSIPVRAPKAQALLPAAWMSPVPLMRATKPRQRITKLPLAVSVSAFLLVVAIIIGALVASSMERDDAMLRANISVTQTNFDQRLQRLEQMPCNLRLVPPTKPVSNVLPIVITAAELNSLQAVIDAGDWNTEPVNETIEYRDKDRQISFRLPYNKAWGNSTYKIAPTEANGSEVINFGPSIHDPVSGAFYRRFSLTILPSPTDRLKPTNSSIVSSKSLGAFTVATVKNADGSNELQFEGKKYLYALTETSASSSQTGLLTIPMNDTTALAILRTLKSF